MAHTLSDTDQFSDSACRLMKMTHLSGDCGSATLVMSHPQRMAVSTGRTAAS